MTISQSQRARCFVFFTSKYDTLRPTPPAPAPSRLGRSQEFHLVASSSSVMEVVVTLQQRRARDGIYLPIGLDVAKLRHPEEEDDTDAEVHTAKKGSVPQPRQTAKQESNQSSRRTARRRLSLIHI